MFRVVSGHAEGRFDRAQQDADVAGAARPPACCCRARRRRNVPEIKAGDLGAVAKLKDTLTNDTLGDKADRDHVPADQVSRAGARLRDRAEEPRRRGQDQHVDAPARGRGSRRSATAAIRRPRSCCSPGQGQLHIEVTVAKLKRRFGVDVNLKPPRIPYRETIKASTEAHGRHKKQTGGHGQFGDCKIKVEPLPRGSDFEFVDDIFGGSIPRQFVPAVEKGIQDARMRGYPRRLPDGRLPRRRCSTARTTTSTRTSCRSSWPARWRSRTR